MKTIDLKNSKIIIDKNAFHRIAVDLHTIYPSAKVLIITDDNVKTLYHDVLIQSFNEKKIKNYTICFESGEKTKNFKNLQKICDTAADYSLNRGDIMLALGGGVIGDLAGFACSVYLRGITFISVPTTLLSQVDSSVGGKTAINISQGKNLVGSFYKAHRVYIDTNTLKTLDKREFDCGMVEVIKYGLISDADFYEFLYGLDSQQELMDHMETIVEKCCTIKASIVYEDEFDKGLRMLLNFGHTIGHAIERTFGYGKYTHGQAIAIGMMMITQNAVNLGLSPADTLLKIRAIFEKFDITTSLDTYDANEIYKACLKDKKNIGEVMNIILLKEVGNAFIHKICPEDLVKFI